MTTCPTCATKLTSAPCRDLISIRHGTGEQSMYSGGSRCEFGGTGWARGHILCPTKVNQIDTVFGQKVVKNGQKGVPPVFTGFLGSLRALWTPHPSCGPSEVVFVPGVHPPGTKTALWAPISRWGVQSARKLPKIVYLGGGGAHLAPCGRSGA